MARYAFQFSWDESEKRAAFTREGVRRCREHQVDASITSARVVELKTIIDPMRCEASYAVQAGGRFGNEWGVVDRLTSGKYKCRSGCKNSAHCCHVSRVTGQHALEDNVKISSVPAKVCQFA